MSTTGPCGVPSNAASSGGTSSTRSRTPSASSTAETAAGSRLNTLAGRWTFQIVEEFDDGYYAPFRALHDAVRDETMLGRRHVFEAELKQRRRTHGRPGHEASRARPQASDAPGATPSASSSSSGASSGSR